MTLTTPAIAERVGRTLIAYAPSETDAALLRQRELLRPVAAGMAERDLALVTIIGQRPAFEAVLIGKDGGEKLRSMAPIPPGRLFETIDAMPMRRQEMRSQR